jgi:hypothetical protein
MRSANMLMVYDRLQKLMKTSVRYLPFTEEIICSLSTTNLFELNRRWILSRCRRRTWQIQKSVSARCAYAYTCHRAWRQILFLYLKNNGTNPTVWTPRVRLISAQLLNLQVKKEKVDVPPMVACLSRSFSPALQPK